MAELQYFGTLGRTGLCAGGLSGGRRWVTGAAGGCGGGVGRWACGLRAADGRAGRLTKREVIFRMWVQDDWYDHVNELNGGDHSGSFVQNSEFMACGRGGQTEPPQPLTLSFAP